MSLIMNKHYNNVHKHDLLYWLLHVLKKLCKISLQQFQKINHKKKQEQLKCYNNNTMIVK